MIMNSQAIKATIPFISLSSLKYGSRPAPATNTIGIAPPTDRTIDETPKSLVRSIPLGVIENASPEDTLSWYKAISAVFSAHGIGRAAWSYRRMNFGLSDERLDGVRDELIKCL